MLRKYPRLYQDPSISYPEYNLDLTFADYITQYKNIIATTRQDLTNDQADKIIIANTPFTLSPTYQKTRYGALLIHGLLDSPFIMKDMGVYLQSQGLTVHSLLLPGHGTVPGSLLHVHYHDWLQSVRYGITTLSQYVDKIFLVGYSTGALTALYQTLTDEKFIAGLIAIAPALKINSSFANLAKWPTQLSKEWPRAAWMGLAKEDDYAKYTSITFNSVNQVYQLGVVTEQVQQRKTLSCPVFFVLTHDDKIVSSSISLQFFKKNTHKKSRLIYYTNSAIEFNDPRILLRNSAYPEQRILNFCHISLPVAPTNPHYGKNGEAPIASHVEDNNHFAYCALDKPLSHYYDMLYHLKLIKHPRKRLSFNPDFDFMMQQINEFIFSV